MWGIGNILGGTATAGAKTASKPGFWASTGGQILAAGIGAATTVALPHLMKLKAGSDQLQAGANANIAATALNSPVISPGFAFGGAAIVGLLVFGGVWLLTRGR